MACSRPGLTFATTENPWQARVLGKVGPYRPFSSVNYPSFGIAIATGFVQSVSLGLAGTGVGHESFLRISLHFCCCSSRHKALRRGTPPRQVFPACTASCFYRRYVRLKLLLLTGFGASLLRSRAKRIRILPLRLFKRTRASVTSSPAGFMPHQQRGHPQPSGSRI